MTAIKYRSPSSNEWKSIALSSGIEEKTDIDENRKNKNVLADILLSSMQMQNVIVLAGSGTSLGSVGGPSMWRLWIKCTTNDEYRFSLIDQSCFNSETNKSDGIYKIPDLFGVDEYYQILKSKQERLTIKIGETENLNEQIYSYNQIEDVFDNTKLNYTKEADKIFEHTNYPINNNTKLNIEDLLSWCEAYLQINENIEVKNFVDSCKKIILNECTFVKAGDQLDGHRTFVHRLSKRRSRDSRLKIFTTNYDTCFEEAASNQGLVVIDGFSFTQPRYYDPRFFDYDIVRRSLDNNQSDSFVEGVFQIYKLHGSVNWKRDRNSKFIVESTPQPEDACMIFPAKGKYQQSYIQPHLELMARYLSCLRNPNTCVVITGFGFNDDHLSEPLVSAIKSNPNLKIIIADFSAEVNITGENTSASKYWNTLVELSDTGSDITFINASFQDFATLIPDLSSLSPADKLMQDIKNIVGSK